MKRSRNMNNIIIGITGGIAAYKTLSLIRALKKLNYNVKVIVSENALRFITKTTIEILSQNRVYDTLWSERSDTSHISLAEWGDLMIVAPATANILGKFANGIADDILSTSLLSFDKSVIMVPSMNSRMYDNIAVQNNIKTLKDRGVVIIEPDSGFLACGETGKGRFPDIEKIMQYIERTLTNNNILSNKRILISAGGTLENIDPVRVITNVSSGKTGNAFAKACWLFGSSHITMIHGNMQEKPYIMSNAIYTPKVEDMYKAIKREIKKHDILIMAAAVSDFKCEYNNKKIKAKEITLKLKENINILKKIKNEKILKIGFALESDNLIKNGKEKLKKYNLDYIIVNSIANINNSKGEYIVLSKDGSKRVITKKDKDKAAMEILKWIV